MKFSVNIKGKKVLEILDNSSSLRRLLWGALISIPVTALIWKLPDILGVLLK